MKKTFGAVSMLALSIFFSTNGFASEVQKSLPLRSTFENVGYTVGWIEDTKQINVKKKDKELSIDLAKKQYTMDGLTKNLTEDSYIRNDRFYIQTDILEKVLNGDEKLGYTNWQGTTVMTKQDNEDVTALNSGFIGLAKYDSNQNRYEFFDKATGQTRDDMGVFFVTQDQSKRILISQSKNYNVIVDLTTLDDALFVYEREGKISDEQNGLVRVSHIPYEGKLAFTKPAPVYNKTTGTIDTSKEGRDILSSTNWQGTVVLDEKGNDVSEFNQNFLGLAKYDASTNKYEFFKKDTGETRGDYGYYDVLNNNKVRAHVSVGMKYAAALELTELNSKKFTYTRLGKDANGNDITVFVEHVPYNGDLKLAFTF